MNMLVFIRFLFFAAFSGSLLVWGLDADVVCVQSGISWLLMPAMAIRGSSSMRLGCSGMSIRGLLAGGWVGFSSFFFFISLPFSFLRGA